MKKFFRPLTLSWLVGLLVFSSVGNLWASEKFRTDPLSVFVGKDAEPWGRVERLIDEHPGFTPEAYPPQGVHLNALIAKWFGGNTAPPSGEFLLHCVKGFDGKTFPTPVLLVPGSCDNANRGYIHPWDVDLPTPLPNERKGFALHLANLGYSVFAVTFAHTQGCNIMQSEHVANAITRIRILLKRQNDPNFKVNIIAHSKGNIAARLYCSDGRAIFPKKTFLTRFRKDVRNYIAIASPMQGIDTPFRYYLYNLSLAMKGNLNAPYGADSILYYGMNKDCRELTVFNDSKKYFPGQAQMLYNLVRDGKEPLGLESYTLADGNRTMYSLYFGGKSLLLSSRGIDKAIDDGERLIYRLNDQGLDPSVSIGVIAGNNPALSFKTEVFGYIPLSHEILSAPFDGLLFVSSATYLDGVLKRGAKLIGKEVLHFNHLEVSRESKVLKLIDSWLFEKIKKPAKPDLE